MTVHQQIFFLIYNFDTKRIEPSTHQAYQRLVQLFQAHHLVVSPQYIELKVNTKLGLIDLTQAVPELRLGDTVFWGYMFATSFKEKSLLTIDTVLANFEELVLNKNHDQLDHLYREAYRTR